MWSLLNVRKLKDPILIVAPHPDDDILSSGGLIQHARRFGKSVYVLFLTVGDASDGAVRNFLKKPLHPQSFIQLGNGRRMEAIRAAKCLGIPQNHLFFLAYPDGALMKIANARSSQMIVRSSTTHLSQAAYPFAFHRNVRYSKDELLKLISIILKKIKPGTIILNHESDHHPDHRAARKLVLQTLHKHHMKSTILSYLIHYTNYPVLPPVNLRTRTILRLPLSTTVRKRAIAAFRNHQSQFHSYYKLIRENEYFWIG